MNNGMDKTGLERREQKRRKVLAQARLDSVAKGLAFCLVVFAVLAVALFVAAVGSKAVSNAIDVQVNSAEYRAKWIDY